LHENINFNENESILMVNITEKIKNINNENENIIFNLKSPEEIINEQIYLAFTSINNEIINKNDEIY
jgi:hypothetical protein